MSGANKQSAKFSAISTIDSGQSAPAILPISNHDVIGNSALPSSASYESSNAETSALYKENNNSHLKSLKKSLGLTFNPYWNNNKTNDREFNEENRGWNRVHIGNGNSSSPTSNKNQSNLDQNQNINHYDHASDQPDNVVANFINRFTTVFRSSSSDSANQSPSTSANSVLRSRSNSGSKKVRFSAITEVISEIAGEFISSNEVWESCNGIDNSNYQSSSLDSAPSTRATYRDSVASKSLAPLGGASPNPGMQYSTFEEILADVGSFGRYQRVFLFLVQLVVLAYCGNYVFMTYAIVEPKYRCQYHVQHDLYLGNESLLNKTSHSVVNVTLEEWDNLTTCEVLQQCREENLTATRDFYGIVEEWSLQCHLDYIPNLILTLERVGSLFGSQIGGYLADHWGRRLVFLISHSFGIFLSFSCVLTHGWLGFAVIRTMIGVSMSASQVSFFTWSMELTDSSHNMVMNLASNWQFIYMFSALIGYLTGSWRRYLTCINLLAVLAIPILFRFGESPRWLIQQKRTIEAAKSLNMMQRLNGSKSLDPPAPIQAQSLHNIRVDITDRHYTFIHLFHTRELRIYTAVLSLITFTASLVANTFLFNLRHLAGNPFLDIFIYGALRSWIPFAVWAIDRRFISFGRKTLFYIGVGTILICLMMVVLLFEVETTKGANLRLITGFGVFAAAMCAPLWTCLGQYQVELYPTVIRNIAMGFTFISGEIGGLLAPQIIYLEKSWESLPYCVNAVIVLITFIVGAIFLPETKGCNLPDLLSNTVALPPGVQETLGDHRKPEDFFSLVDDDQLASNTADLVMGDQLEENGR